MTFIDSCSPSKALVLPIISLDFLLMFLRVTLQKGPITFPVQNMLQTSLNFEVAN